MSERHRRELRVADLGACRSYESEAEVRWRAILIPIPQCSCSAGRKLPASGRRLKLLLVLREEFDRGRILGQLSFTFDDHRLVGALGSNHTARILCQVARLARALSSAEIKAAINPYAPDDHGVRRSIRSRSRDPVIVRFLQALFGPFP